MTKSAETIKFEDLKNKIASMLLVDPAWVEKAIVVLYQHQTSDEQAAQETGHNNGRGFNKPDARRMSFVAEFLLSGKHLTRQKALEKYGPRLVKYSGQLAKIALAKQPSTAPSVAPAVTENRCPRCNVVRCPDGCCCGC